MFRRLARSQQAPFDPDFSFKNYFTTSTRKYISKSSLTRVRRLTGRLIIFIIHALDNPILG